jgi:hypothetical protein
MLAVFAAALGALVFASPAMAQGNVGFKAMFTESIGTRNGVPPSCVAGDLCGSGNAAGVGRFTENIVFGGGCGGTCDLRTFTFADGSTLVTEETEGLSSVPGKSYKQPAHAFGHPFTVPLTDTVDGSLSTGVFAGAAGTLQGDVMEAGSTAVLDLSGTITLA